VKKSTYIEQSAQPKDADLKNQGFLEKFRKCIFPPKIVEARKESTRVSGLNE
jgi:hypothetical protein